MVCKYLCKCKKLRKYNFMVLDLWHGVHTVDIRAVLVLSATLGFLLQSCTTNPISLKPMPHLPKTYTKVQKEKPNILKTWGKVPREKPHTLKTNGFALKINAFILKTKSFALKEMAFVFRFLSHCGWMKPLFLWINYGMLA